MFHMIVNYAVEQNLIRGSHTTLSNPAGDGDPVGESVIDADTAGCVCVQLFWYSHNLGWDADGVENVP